MFQFYQNSIMFHFLIVNVAKSQMGILIVGQSFCFYIQYQVRLDKICIFVIQDHAGRLVAALSKKLHYPFGHLKLKLKLLKKQLIFLGMLVFEMSTLNVTHFCFLMLLKKLLIFLGMLVFKMSTLNVTHFYFLMLLKA